MNQTTTQPHDRRPLLWCATLLILLWIVTIALWIYDAAGDSMGMPMPLFFVHLLLPLVAGLVVGWRATSLAAGTRAGAMAGALFGLANMGALLLWSGILYLLGRVSADQPFTLAESVFEALEFLLLYALVGLVLGAVGGAVGAVLGRRDR